MKLYSQPGFALCRKARVIAHELGLKLEVIDILPRSDRNSAASIRWARFRRWCWMMVRCCSIRR